MTARELLTILATLDDSQLDLPVEYYHIPRHGRNCSIRGLETDETSVMLTDD